MNQELNDKIVNTLSLYCAENNEGRFNDFDLFGAANAIEELMEAQVSDVGELHQQNIDFAADAVASTVFCHFTDKEKLKTALKMFANIIINQPPKQ